MVSSPPTQIPGPPPRRRLRRLALIVAAAGGGIASSALLGALGLGAWISSQGGSRWLQDQVEERISDMMTGARLELGGLELRPLSGLGAHDVVVRSAQGEELLRVDRLAASFEPWALLKRRVELPRIELQGVTITLNADEQGSIDWAELFGAGSTDAGPFSLPVEIVISELRLAGVDVRYHTPDGLVAHLSGLQGGARISGSGHEIALEDVGLSGQLSAPGPLALAAEGALIYSSLDGLALDGVRLRIPRGDLSLEGQIGEQIALGIRIDELHADTLAPLVGSDRLRGDWGGSLALSGTSSDLSLVASLGGQGDSQGSLVAQGRLDLAAEDPTFELTAEVASLHLDDLLAPVDQPVILGGVVEIAGRGLRWPDDLSLEGSWRGGEQEVYGQRVGRVDARFSLEQGQLDLHDTFVDGVVGLLSVDGAVDLVQGPMDVRLKGQLRSSDLVALGADGLDGDGAIEVRITGDVIESPGRLRAQGAVRYAPLRYDDQIEIADLTGRFDARIDGSDVRILTDLEAAGVSAPAASIAQLHSTALSVHVRPSGEISVDGVVGGAGVVLSDAVTAAEIEAQLSMLIAEENAVDAVVRLRDYTLLERGGSDGVAVVALRGDQIRFETLLEDQGRQVLDTRGGYHLTRSELSLDALTWAPSPRSSWMLQEPGHLTLTDSGVTDAHLIIEGNLGRIGLEGQLGTSGTLDGQLITEGLQLDLLAELYPERFSGLSGALDLSLQLRGSAEAPQLDVTVALTDLYLDGVARYLDVQGQVAVQGGWARPQLEIQVADTPLAHLSGQLPLVGGLRQPGVDLRRPTELSMALLPGSLERLSQAAPSLADAGLPTGRISALAEIHGPLDAAEVRIAGVMEADVEGLPQGRVEFDLRREADDLWLRSDVRQGLQQRAMIDGTAQTRLGEVIAWALDRGPEPELYDPELYADALEIDTTLLGVPLAGLASLLSSPVSAEGEIVGGISVTGSPTEPVVEGGLSLLEARIGGRVLDGAYASVVPSERGYTLDSLISLGGGSLVVQGDVPISIDLEQDWTTWEQGALDLMVDAAQLPLSTLSALDPDVRGAEGTLSLEGYVGGTLSDPSPVIQLALEGGRFVHQGLGISLDDIDLHLDMDKDRVRLQQLAFSPRPARRLSVNPLDLERAGPIPRVGASGTVRLQGWRPTEVDADVVLTNGPWLISTDDKVIRTDGAIGIEGTWPQLEVDGHLDLVQGRIGLDLATLEGAAPLELDNRLRVVRGHGSLESIQPKAAPEPPLYSQFDVDVDVRLQRNLVLDLTLPFLDDLGVLGAGVSRMDLTTRLGGEVEASLQGGDPTVVGQVELLDGQVRVLQSVFEIEGGTIQFPGGSPAENAILDVSTKMTSDRATLELQIGGTPYAPHPKLSSEELPDRTQQVTMLITGRAPDELSTTEGEGAMAALGQLLLQSLVGNQNLGTFSFDPDGTVRLAIPVSQDVRVASTYAPGQQELNENTVTAEAEVSLARGMVASGGVGDRLGWFDLFWEVRF
ncbi:MAG TPA: hypothetical protein ENK18_09320 [Deltaproteobacteria bacterium]|nr:hypothetical protein [Deltaproteobacteria bacterium]